MKTLCFALGLLLITVCCCDAAGDAAHIFTSPGNCCFGFSNMTIPQRFISHITKTHSSCLHKAFILSTIRRRQICYRQTFQWALDVYNKLHKTKGSKQ
ncbi:hypothetical protein Q5P01_011927 [Channa striata]|uniref:Chemokine interleukin-8-like domain-containing protein n=1 Tax=Channa striata TaxID=64152 RepID=A0AA88MMH7_CHASR|nr:hypothetical protein Q5P01_011927 [Channa striata]